MKRIFRSKSFRTLSLMAMLTVIAGASVQQSLQAQNKIEASSQTIRLAQASTRQTRTIVDIAANNPNFSTLVTAIKAAGLTETLSGNTPLTVFAPTNAAFAALPKGTLETLLKPENRAVLRRVLTYHVVPGAVESRTLRSERVASVEGNSVTVAVNRNQIRVNNARVISADVRARNGVVHVIDRVLLPPDLVSKAPTQSRTIVDIAAANSEFSTLVTALKAAGLTETLSSRQPFTVFAPTNKAFAALPKGTLEKLLKPENRNLLRRVLTYHVVSGDLMAKNLRSGRVATVEGNRVNVRVGHGRIRVNNSNVVKADVDAKNGVIHAIDRVLLPPDL